MRRMNFLQITAWFAALGALVGVPWLSVTTAGVIVPLAAFTALSGIGALGLALAWKSLDQYSKALAEGEALDAIERNRLRGALLRDRLYVMGAFVLLGASLGTGGVVGKLLLPAPPTDPVLFSQLVFALGAALALATLTLGALLRLFLSLDGFIGEIRDRARVQRAREQLQASSAEAVAERSALLSDDALRIKSLTH